MGVVKTTCRMNLHQKVMLDNISSTVVFRLFVFLRLTWPSCTNHLHNHDVDALNSLPLDFRAKPASCRFANCRLAAVASQRRVNGCR